MRYRHFRIKNFKGIRELSIDLDRTPESKVFALVGLNESGKTTILEAIHWFRDPTHYDTHKLIPKSQLANFNDTIEVSAVAGISDGDRARIEHTLRKQHRFSFAEPLGSTVTITRFAKFRDSEETRSGLAWKWDDDIYGTVGKERKPRKRELGDPVFQSLTQCCLDELLPEIVYYPNLLFDFPEKLYLKRVDDGKLDDNQQLYRDVIQDVFNAMPDGMTIDKHLVDRYCSGKTRALASMGGALDKLASLIEDYVLSSWRDLLRIDESGLSITLGHTLRQDEIGYYLQVMVKEGDQTYHIAERSLGFRWFFAFVLLTYFRAFRHENRRNTLFLLDEPASNLHPTAQAKLLAAFAGFPEDQSIVYTTHSHHMINTRWLCDTFVVKNSAREYRDVDVRFNSRQTNISAERYAHFVAHYPDSPDYFRPIMDALDYQPSQLDLVPELVVVEGKNDYYTLKYFIEMGLVACSRSHNILPSRGKDHTDYVVELYLGWGRSFLVLLDDDKGGRETYTRLRDTYGVSVENRVFKLSHINRDWRGYTMENVFVDRDQLKVLRTVFPDERAFVKGKFNKAIEVCYANRHDLRLTQHTVNRAQKVFGFLDEKLVENELAHVQPVVASTP